MSQSSVPDQLAAWPKAKLSALGTLLTGQSPPTSSVNRDGRGTAYVSGPEQWDGSRVHANKWTTQPKRIAPTGSIFVTVKGAGVGKVFPGVNAAIGRDIYAFVPAPEVLPRFVEHALRHSIQEVLRHAAGDIPGLSKRHILDHEIPAPPYRHQCAVVAEIEKQFSRLDEAVASLERAKTNLARYKAATLKAAVEGRLVPTEASLSRLSGQPYESGTSLVSQILTKRRRLWSDTSPYRPPAGPIDDPFHRPYGWGLATAEQLTDPHRVITYGVIKLGPTVAEGVPTLRSSDVRPLRLDLTDVKTIDPQIANDYRRTYLRGGEVLITVRGTLGGVAVAPQTCQGFNISREVAMLALVELTMPELILYFIASAPLQRWLLQRTKGIAYTGINIETLRSLPIPLPPLAEQQRIVAEVDRLMSITRATEAQLDTALARAARLRQSILSRAFAGASAPT